jgi:hypothetical protein
MENFKTNIELARSMATSIVRINAYALKTFADLSVQAWEDWNKQVDTAFSAFESNLTKKN